MKIILPVFVLLLTPCLRAELKTVSFQAEIRTIQEPIAGLKRGDIISGKYTYDPETKDENGINPNVGDYYFRSPHCGLLINLNGKALKTRFGRSLGIEVVNNLPDQDSYTVWSIDSVFDGDDFVPESAYLTLTDTSGLVFKSVQLPTTAPVLRRFDYRNQVAVFGRSGDDTPYFYANILKITDGDGLFLPLVEILPSSGDFIHGRMIEPVIRIEGAEADEVVIERILLDDVDVTKRYLTASREGRELGGHPGRVWQLRPPNPSPGEHVFVVEARFKDGRTVQGRANWNVLQAKMETPNPHPIRNETETNPDAILKPRR